MFISGLEAELKPSLPIFTGDTKVVVKCLTTTDWEIVPNDLDRIVQLLKCGKCPSPVASTSSSAFFEYINSNNKHWCSIHEQLRRSYIMDRICGPLSAGTRNMQRRLNLSVKRSTSATAHREELWVLEVVSLVKPLLHHAAHFQDPNYKKETNQTQGHSDVLRKKK